MKLFLFIFGTYLIIFLGLRIYFEFNIKQNHDKKYKFFKRLIQISNVGFILFPILFVRFFWYALGVSCETHYDVKKGSWMWFMRMENDIVNDFPIIEPIGREKYNDVGGDNPNIGAAWSVEYVSRKTKQDLMSIINEYLSKKGIKITELLKSPCRIWREKENAVYYTNINGFDGNCLELEIEESENGTWISFYISV